MEYALALACGGHAAYAFRCAVQCSAMHDDESVQKMILICVLQCTARMAQEIASEKTKNKNKISVTKIRFSRYALQVNIHLEKKFFWLTTFDDEIGTRSNQSVQRQ